MSKAGYNLSAAVIANEYVKKKMTIGASNKLRPDFWRAWKCSGSLVNTGEMREKVDRDIAEAFAVEPVSSDLDYRIKAQKIYLEKSAIAFVYLRGQKTFPLDWMEVNDYQHAFVIIGRRRGSDPKNYARWGDDAVICDPWRDVVATVKSEALYFSTRAPNWLYGEGG